MESNLADLKGRIFLPPSYAGILEVSQGSFGAEFSGSICKSLIFIAPRFSSLPSITPTGLPFFLVTLETPFEAFQARLPECVQK